MNPREKPRDAVRAAFLSLDCPQAALTELIETAPESVLENAGQFEEYVQAAIDTVTITPTAATGITSFQEFVTFPALAPLRVQQSDPLADTPYEAREPPGSAERRMVRQPLQKHPGLTWFECNAREYYIATLTQFFEEHLPDGLQAEIAAVLLAPDRVDTTSKTAYQTYADTDPEAVHQRYAERVTVTETGDVHVPTEYLSRCCQLLSKSDSNVGFAYPDEFQSLHITGGSLVIPNAQFRLHLAEYAWHAWRKLVSIAFDTIPRTDINQLVTATPRVDTDIYGRFDRNNSIYYPYYATSGVENPKRDWAQKTAQSATTRPRKIEDKRLLTAVDCIRATPDLEFDSPIPLDTLFNRICSFFPAPHRPGNDIQTKATLRNALDAATHSNITLNHHSDPDTLLCTIPSPKYPPYHPTPATAPWDCYRQILAKHRRIERTNLSPTKPVRPLLPPRLAPPQLTNYETRLANAQQTAVTSQRDTTTIHNATPRIDSESVPALTHDELVVLTRISLAMERRLEDASLTRSMRPLRYTADGTELQIDEAKLRDQGWLERHAEGPEVLYTVPAKKRRELRIENISHDGYGEKTPAEKSVHRKGVDQCAAALAAKPDVTTVIRYCDLWRLQNTKCAPALANHDLFSTRIDVLAFNNSTPAYAAGIETASRSKAKSKGCVQKLAALTDTIETWLVTPDSEHLWTVMKRANDPDGLDFNTFPDSTKQAYDRANWKRELTSEGFLGNTFDTLHTYQSLPHAKLDPETDTRHQKVLGIL